LKLKLLLEQTTILFLNIAMLKVQLNNMMSSSILRNPL